MTTTAATTVVAVIGGGPAGAVTALALARLGVPVMLIERGDGGGNPIGETLAPSATPLLHRLGLYDALLASGPQPSYANRSAWGGDGTLAEYDFLRSPYGPGWHLDRPAFNRALLAAAMEAGADSRRQTRFCRAERSPDGRWRLHLDAPSGSSRVEADLVVDATGRAAAFARHQGARRRSLDRLTAVVATVEPAGAAAPDATTLVEATEEGWWYSAPLPSGRLVTAYFSDPDLLTRRRPWQADGWWTHLANSRHTQARVATFGSTLAGPPRTAAAGSVYLDPIAGEGWLAAGDAAAAYDPLSSHGIGSALAAGQRAATAAAAYLGGDRRSSAAYADRIAAGYAEYVRLWLAYYADERRWPEAPFWRRRQELRAIIEGDRGHASTGLADLDAEGPDPPRSTAFAPD